MPIEVPALGDPREPAVPIVERMRLVAAKIGPVAKNLRNVESGYAARSIDDVIDAVHGPLTEHGIVLRPEVLDRVAEARVGRNGNALYNVALRIAFHFCSVDGETFSVVTWGEATDSSDKATNKAASAALKMALLQTFTIPLQGEDADAQTPESIIEMATDEQVQRVGTALMALWERVGRRAHPQEWRDAGLPTWTAIGQHGLTAAQYPVAMAAVEAAARRIEGLPAKGTDADPIVLCDECGMPTNDHAEGCSNGPF